MQNNAKRRGVSLLLIVGLLIVAIAAIIPLAIAADGAPAQSGEIEDLGYQTLSGLNLANDNDTDLRFLFTIGKLDYSEVGFVISKSNSTPTIGGANCYKAGTTTVYSTITADSTPSPAPAGRYWAAVKLTNIPHSYFDGSFYLRAFVTDGEGTRYSVVTSFTVCSAAGHTHEINEFEHQRTGGTAALDVVGTIIGNCPGCNLEVTLNDVKAGVENQHWTAGGGQKRMYDRRQISDVLAGGKHFYPDESNGGLGNDLVIEYSVLWNETLLNLSPTNNDGARLLTTFDTTDSGFSGDYRAIAYASLTDNVADSGAKFAGAFEYPSGLIQTSEPGDPHPGMAAGGGAYSAYANLGGTDRDHPEWGWHRVGVVYHEDVTNLAAVRDNDAAATYKLTVTIYIDGEVVSILSGDHLDRNSADYKLFTATHDGHGGVTYEDIDEDVWVFAFLVPYVKAPSADAWFADGDVFVTAGHDFVHPVTRIANPAPRTETVDGHDFSGAFYYTSVGSHDHVWGNWNQISEATLLDPGIDRRYCSICGMNDDREIPFTHNVQKFTTSTSGNYDPYSASLGSIRGSEHFYTSGNDLLVEYSVLWTEALTNLSAASYNSGKSWYKPYMDTRLTSGAGPTDHNKNIIYWSLADNVNGSDCKFAGGFEWGGIDQNKPDNPYPKFTASVWDAEKEKYVTGDEITEFPNIGGLNGGDGTPQGDPRYGWHRVSIRYRNEVTNVDAVKGGADATYNLEMWVYVDGVLVIHAYQTDHKDTTDVAGKQDRKLFSAACDGNGGIAYTENDWLYLHGAYLNSKKMASGTAYFEIADYSATIGSDFVQNVRRVNNPTSTTLEVENGVFVPSTMWYELAD